MPDRVKESGSGAMTPWARLVSGVTHDPMGYDAKGGAFVLAPDGETVLARFPKEEDGHRAFHAVNSNAALVKALEEAREHASHIKAFAKCATAENVQDMLLRIERQASQLSATIDAAGGE